MEINVPSYSPAGVPLEWDKDFEIAVAVLEDGVIRIVANRAGLRSLARMLLTLSEDVVPSGTHVHLDEYNSLEQGSAELIVERSGNL